MLLQIIVYFVISSVLLYVCDYIYNYLSNEFTDTKVKDYIQQPKEEYERIMDSLRHNYEQKQTLFNTRQNQHISNPSSFQKQSTPEQSNMKSQLLQYIKQSKQSKHSGSQTQTQSPTPSQTYNELTPTNLEQIQINNNTRRNLGIKEVVYPTQDLQIRDDVTVFTDYSEIR